MAKRRRKRTLCSNCNYRFEGIDNFCPNCGQENHSHHAPIKHLLVELLEGITHFDTKFAETTKTLFLRPGQITKDYILDRRARYVPPVRMYIFISFVFFFCLTLISRSGEYERTEPRGVRGDSVAGVGFSIGNNTVDFGDRKEAAAYAEKLVHAPRVTSEMIDSVIVAKNPDIGWIPKIFLRQAIKAQLGLISEEKVFQAYFKNIGITLFFFMPIFAFLLQVFSFKHRRLYIEHLIFSVHFHSFILAVLTLTLVLSSITGDDIWLFLFLIGVPMYGAIAMKRVYERPWGRTLIKSLFLTIVYGGVVLVGLLAVLIISAVTA